MGTKTYNVKGSPVTVPQHLQRGFESANPNVPEWPSDKPQNAKQARKQQQKEVNQPKK